MTLGVKYLGEGGGTTAVAAYAVLMYSGEMCQPLLYGMSDSLSPALGYNWGAENYGRVKKIAKCGFIGTGAVGLVATVILIVLSEPIASLFTSAHDTALLELSGRAIKLFSLAFLFRWVSIATQSFLSAIEKPIFATFTSVAVAFIFPVIMLGALWQLGLDGIWLNLCGTSVLAAILSVALIIPIFMQIKKKPVTKSKT
jgi:Na+-driven multidrug efflux pump